MINLNVPTYYFDSNISNTSPELSKTPATIEVFESGGLNNEQTI